MSWSHEELEIVQTRWAAGDSAAEIARQLRGRTRNAVIGKVHRNGYTRDGDVDMELVTKRRVRQRTRNKHHAPRPDRQERGEWVEPIVRPISELLEIYDCPLGASNAVRALDEHQCKFPIGDPSNADFHFCGGAKKAGSSYCTHHHAATHKVYIKSALLEPSSFHVNGGLNFMTGVCV